MTVLARQPFARLRKTSVRVLHILPSIQGYGAERIVVELLKQLENTDVDAALLTIYAPAAPHALPFPVLTAGRRNRGDRLFLWNLANQIRAFRPDIVHTHTHVGKYWGRVAALLAGVRCIVHTEHNPCDSRPRTSFERAADALLHRATARVVTFFGEQAAALSRTEHLSADKVVAIPNGLTIGSERADRGAARRLLELDDDRLAILTIGRMEYQKNHALALEAFAALRPDLASKSVLLFAGSGELENDLRERSRVLRVADRVRFLGYRTDVPLLLPGADLVLMTSRFEGMPIALLEAMLANVPVITTPWLGAHNMLGDGQYGVLAADFEAQSVATAIELAAEHPTLRHELAGRAASYVRETFDIRRMTEAHRKLYLDLHGDCES